MSETLSSRFLSKEPAPSDSEEEEDFDVAAKLPHHHLQRKQRRKSRRQSQEEGEERPIIRGLWVQEIDWLKSAEREMTSAPEIIPPPPQFTDSAQALVDDSCADVLEDESLSEEQDKSGDTEDSESIHTHESDSDSSCGTEDDSHAADSSPIEARNSNLTFDLMNVSGYNSHSHTEWECESSGCVQSLLGMSDSTDSPGSVNISQSAFGFDDMSDSDTVLDFLRGRVTQMPRLSVSPFFMDLMKQTLNGWKTSRASNEGLIFHHVRYFHQV